VPDPAGGAAGPRDQLIVDEPGIGPHLFDLGWRADDAAGPGLASRCVFELLNISDAALFRVIAERAPTLLLDEVDTIFSPKARDREDMRGMLNAGYRQGAMAWRMGGPNMRSLESFPVFCPKMFAGIGELPDTIADRTIPIRLLRRTRDEEIERFRRREVEAEAAMLRDRAADWCEPQLEELRGIRPVLPDELDDRAQDCWEPLLAISDLAGGDWADRARAAALALSTGEEREDESIRVRLLADIDQVFSTNGTERYRTADLIAELAKVEESPWGDWYGKTITPQALGKLLKPFRIKTMPVWIDGEANRGYKVEQFEDVFLRVLGVRGVRGVRSSLAPDAAPNTPNAPNTQGTNGDDRLPIPGDPDYPRMDRREVPQRVDHRTRMARASQAAQAPRRTGGVTGRPSVAAPLERYVDARELAELMGVSTTTIKRFVAAGMPSENWGMTRTRRFLPSRAMAWAHERGRIRQPRDRDGNAPGQPKE
jgi:hypothetical protein